MKKEDIKKQVLDDFINCSGVHGCDKCSHYDPENCTKCCVEILMNDTLNYVIKPQENEIERLKNEIKRLRNEIKTFGTK